MGKLQEALSKVQAPKIDIRSVQGQSYRATEQRAGNVEQTNYAGQLAGIMSGIAKVSGEHVDRQWAAANKDYEEAKAKGMNPAIYIQDKAKAESEGLVGGILSAVQGAVGYDPLAYNKAVLASRKAEDMAHSIDKELLAKQAAGDFRTWDEFVQTRDDMRKAGLKDLSDTLGIDKQNPYIQEGMAVNNTQSLKYLEAQQALITDDYIRKENKQLQVSDRNALYDQGYREPKGFMAQLDVYRKDGTIQNDREYMAAIEDTLSMAADKGDVSLLNGLLNEKVDINKQKGLLGDIIPSGTRDAIMLKAQTQAFAMNRELSDNFSRRQGEIAALSMTNPTAALRQLDALGEELRKTQPTDMVTPQSQQLSGLRNQVLQTQGRLNIENAQRLQAAQAVAQQEDHYNSMLDKALTNPFSTGDHTMLGVDAKVARKVVDSRITAIMQDETLTQGERIERAANLINVVSPNNPAAYGAKVGFQRAEDSLTQVIALAKSGLGDGKVPEQMTNIMNMYRENPTAVAKIIGVDAAVKLGDTVNMVDELGGENLIQLQANTKPFDKEQTKEFTDTLDTGAVNMTTTELALVKSRAQMFYQTNGGDMEAAIKLATKKRDEYNTDVTFDAPSDSIWGGGEKTDSLPNHVLTPSAGTSMIPMVSERLTNKVTTIAAENPDDLISVTYRGNQIVIANYTSGLETITTADKLLEEARGEAEKARWAKEAAIIKEEEQSKKKREAQAKRPYTGSILG